MLRDGISEDSAAQRIEAQMPDDEYIKLADRLIENNGAINCSDLLGCDVTTEEGMEVLRQKRQFCEGLVAGSIEILEELGY